MLVGVLYCHLAEQVHSQCQRDSEGLRHRTCERDCIGRDPMKEAVFRLVDCGTTGVDPDASNRLPLSYPPTGNRLHRAIVFVVAISAALVGGSLLIVEISP